MNWTVESAKKLEMMLDSRISMSQISKETGWAISLIRQYKFDTDYCLPCMSCGAKLTKLEIKSCKKANCSYKCNNCVREKRRNRDKFITPKKQLELPNHILSIQCKHCHYIGTIRIEVSVKVEQTLCPNCTQMGLTRH